jgi:hypothetical protein
VRPELPYLAAGSVAIAGGMAREKTWPSNGAKALMATMIVVVIASATSNTSVAPLVRAIGLLVLLTSVMASVPVFMANQKKEK